MEYWIDNVDRLPIAHSLEFHWSASQCSLCSHARAIWLWLDAVSSADAEADVKNIYVNTGSYQNANMSLIFLALTLLLANSGRCLCNSAPSFIPQPFTECVQSRGKDALYRGAIDVTESGARCINWTAVVGFTERYPGKGLGQHNHCRNPDARIRPWCFFRKHKERADWGYCDCKQGKHV